MSYVVSMWNGVARVPYLVRGLTIDSLGTVAPYVIRGSSTGSTAPPPLKPRVGGLVIVCDTLKGATNVNTSQLNNGINHVMIRIAWKALQPDTTGVVATDSAAYVWSFLDSVMNSAPAGTLFKIGVDCGAYAPDWVKNTTGTVNVFNSKDGIYALCPLWWTDFHQIAYANLMNAMGARYDGDSRVLQIISTGAMSVYMEPWILGSDTTSGINMFNAGLNLTVQQAAITRALANTVAAWPHTRVEMPIHTNLQYPISTGMKNLTWAQSRDWFNPLAAQYGEQLMVTDYGVGPLDSNPYGPTAGTTSGALTAGATVTAIPVSAIPSSIANGAEILMPIGQVATLSAGVSAGATSLPVQPFTPLTAIASGVRLYNSPGTTETLSNSQYQYGWMWERSQLGQGPVAYQLTLGTFSIANEKAAADNCLALGGCYSETAGWNGIAVADRIAYDTALKAQAGV